MTKTEFNNFTKDLKAVQAILKDADELMVIAKYRLSELKQVAYSGDCDVMPVVEEICNVRKGLLEIITGFDKSDFSALIGAIEAEEKAAA